MYPAPERIETNFQNMLDKPVSKTLQSPAIFKNELQTSTRQYDVPNTVDVPKF